MRTDDEMNQWLAHQRERDDALYEQYGRPLEAQHYGEYVAISLSGETVVGEDDVAVAQDAIRRFGAGNFAYRRVGYPFVTRWLTAPLRPR